jgi:hypothetical protein
MSAPNDCQTGFGSHRSFHRASVELYWLTYPIEIQSGRKPHGNRFEGYSLLKNICFRERFSRLEGFRTTQLSGCQSTDPCAAPLQMPSRSVISPLRSPCARSSATLGVFTAAHGRHKRRQGSSKGMSSKISEKGGVSVYVLGHQLPLLPGQYTLAVPLCNTIVIFRRVAASRSRWFPNTRL